MRLQFWLAMRELCVHPQRTALVVAALVLGVWGAGTPIVSWLILQPDLAANFERTRPPHLLLHSDDFGRLDLAAFVARPDVESATLRDFGLHRVEVKPDVWLPLFLFGVDDFENAPLAKLLPQAGAHVPPPGSVLVERDGLRVSNFAMGAAPRIRVGGQMRTMPISGVTFDASQAPATQDAFIYAYADRPTWSALTGRPSGQRLALRLEDVHSADDVRVVSGRLQRDLAAAGIIVTRSEVPRFEQHPHQWQLSTLLFLISALGLLSFLMAAVLVSQLMRAVLAGQVQQIGVLKAMGATRRQVLRMALLTSSAMGAMAGLLGVPLAVLSAVRFSAFVAATLNFDVLSVVTPGVVLALCAVSLALPVLFSLPTLLRGTRVTVREALGEVRAVAPAASRRTQRSSLPPMFVLAARNVLRDRTRLVVTVLSMALGVAIFETAFNVRASLWHMLSQASQENRHDVQVVLSAPTSREQALAPFAGVANVARVESWSGGQGEIQSRVLATAEGVGVVALPRDSELLRLRLMQGRWLQRSDQLEVVLNQQGWLSYGHPPVGSIFELTIRGRSQQALLVGLAQQLDRPKLYVDQADFDARFNPQHEVTTLAFVAERRTYAEVLTLKRDLERAVGRSSLPVLFVMSHAERVRIIYDHLDIILVALSLLSFLVLLVSAIGNASAVGVDVLQRTRELGVMRAIGATARAISRLLCWEGLLVSGLGILAGLALAVPLTRVAVAFFGDLMLGEGATLDPALSVLGVVVTVVATFAFGWLASWFPARGALRVPTSEALAWRS
jgi:putative ABC transport system permease protein